MKLFKGFLVLLCLSFILLHFSAQLFSPYLNHDVALNLTAGGMILEGCRPYVEVIDVNPPFIMYLNLIPAVFARTSGIDLATSGYLFYILIDIICCCLFIYLLNKLKFISSIVDSLVITSFFLFISHVVYILHEYGQRDYLVAIFLLIYSLYRFARFSDISFSRVKCLAFSLFGFLAIAIKLHYIVVIFGCEFILVLRRKRINFKDFLPEFYVFLICGLTYLLHFLIVPEMKDFYTYWLGFIRRGYTVLGFSVVEIIANLYNEYISFLVMILMSPLLILPYIKKRDNSFFLVLYLFVISQFSLVVFFIQAKGWQYHLMPFFVFFMVSCILLTFGLFKYLNSTWCLLIKYLIIVSLIAFTYYPEDLFKGDSFKPFMKFPVDNHYISSVSKKLTKAGDKILIINSHVLPTFPALTYSSLIPASRFLCHFPLLFIFQNTENYEILPEYKLDEKKYYCSLIEDINVNKPKLIFVRSRAELYRMPKYFNVSVYLRRRGFFDEIKKRYKKILSDTEFDTYHILRKPVNID